MRKLSGKEKAELKAKIERAREERVRRIVEEPRKKMSLWEILIDILFGWL